MMTNDMRHHAKEAAQDFMSNPKKEMEKSGEDWLDYIKTHPMQSIAFGLCIWFALKGIIKS